MAYSALELEGLEVGGMVWLEFDGAVVESGEERFGEGELCHLSGVDLRSLGYGRKVRCCLTVGKPVSDVGVRDGHGKFAEV